MFRRRLFLPHLRFKLDKVCVPHALVPRLFLTVYIILLYKTVIWYMDLPDPTMEQSGLISVVVGAGAAWFGLYTGSSKKDK